MKIKTNFLLDYNVRNLCSIYKDFTITKFVQCFPKYFADVNIKSVLYRIAKADPELTMAEYVRIYEPERDANASCMKCRNSICGCSWSRHFIVDKDMIACVKPTKSRDYVNFHEKTHIVYCPQFNEGKAMERVRYDPERSLDLLCAYAKAVANDYRDCLQELPRMREKVNVYFEKAEYYSITRWSSFVDSYFKCLSTKEQCEFALGDKFSSMIKARENYKEDPVTDKFMKKEFRNLNESNRLPKQEDRRRHDND